MKIGIIIQARMGSNRLPGKVLKKLDDKTILEWVIARCKLIKNIDGIVVATSNKVEDDKIVEWCKEQNINYFRGSEENVLQRYIACAEEYKFDWIIRVTSDCPFLDYKVANEVLTLALNDFNFDLWAIKENWTRGLAIELIKLDSLKKISLYTDDDLYQEHVTLYMYNDTKHFLKKDYMVEKSRRYPQFRLTVDTLQDYEVCKQVAKEFNNTSVDCQKIFEYLLQNPKVANLNSEIEQSVLSGNE